MLRDTGNLPTASSITAPWRCPVCGEPNRSTKEHVWGQWLREHSCVKTELQHWHGERIERPQHVTTVDEHGRYRTDIGTVQHVATFLPQVTVKVCTTCNSGWMSALEDDVKGLLGPWIFDARPVRLRPAQQRTIATWAVKTFMTYALTLAPESNPFTPREYKAFARSQVAPSRAHVWMYASTSVRSATGLGINPFTFSDAEFDPAADADNAALGFLAAGHAMFLMVLLPPEVPEGLLDAFAPPPAPHAALMRRITRPTKGWLFPAGKCTEEHMDAVMSWMDLPRHISLPIEGLTRPQMQQASSESISGASIEQLHASYRGKAGVRTAPLAELASMRRNARREAKRLQARDEQQQAARALVQAADSHIDAKDWKEALVLLDEALAIPGTDLDQNAAVAAARGVCLTELERWPEAAAEHRRAMDLGHDTPQTRGDLADALTRCGKYAAALAVLEAEQVNPHAEELPRAELTRGALTHLVHDLEISEQARGNAATLDLDRLTDQEIKELLVSVDALAPELWARRRTSEKSIAFWVARAWFGGQAGDWFQAAAALHSAGMVSSGRHLIRMGFELSPEMVKAYPRMLEAMHKVEMPNVEALAVIWVEEAHLTSSVDGRPAV